MAEMKEIVKLAIDGYKGHVEKYSVGQSQDALRQALVEANEGLAILETSYADEDYAICVAKEKTELLDKINEAIVALTADGTIATIVNKYIK